MVLRGLLSVFLTLILAAPALATTYWASTSGTNGCAAIDGAADPGLYATPATIVSNGCMSAGDTVIFKAGTYTTPIDWPALLPNGTSSAQTIARSETKWGAVIAQTGFQIYGEISLRQMRYVTVDGFDINASSQGQNDSSRCIALTMSSAVAQPGIQILNNHCYGHQSQGITSTESGSVYHDNVLVQGNVIEQASTPLNTANGALHGMYMRVTNSTITRNIVHSPDSAGSSAIQCRVACTNTVISYNLMYVHGNDVGVIGDGATTLMTGIKFHHNEVKAVTGSTGVCIYFHTGWTNSRAYNNVCDGFTTFLKQRSSAGTGNVATNNICLTGGTCTITDDHTPDDLTLTDNLTGVATANFTDRTNGDYTLVASAATLIDSGTAISGVPKNGTVLDLGVSETFVFSSCVVEDGDASTIRVTFENNVAPPLLPSTGITGFTARKAGANDVITSAARRAGADNVIDLTLTTAIVNGNTVDISWSSGNLTDSTFLGNTTNQPYRQTLTNQSCTNNVGAGASYAFTQAAFEFHGLRGTEAAPVGTPYATAPENTNIQVRVGGSVRLRLAITCTSADCPPTGFFPRASKSGGAGYTVVPDVFGTDNIAFCGTGPDPDIPTNGTATTDQLSTSGTFVAGALVRTSNAIPTIDMDVNGKTELEYCFIFDTDATAGDTYDVHIYQQDGTQLTAYTVTPRMTLTAPSAGRGF